LACSLVRTCDTECLGTSICSQGDAQEKPSVYSVAYRSHNHTTLEVLGTMSIYTCFNFIAEAIVDQRPRQPSIPCEVFNASTGADLVWSIHCWAYEKERSAHSAVKRYGLVSWQEGRSRIKRGKSTPANCEILVWTGDAGSVGSTDATYPSRQWFLAPRRPERSRLRHVRTLILPQIRSRAFRGVYRHRNTCKNSARKG
jgi:hypothetical protein